MRQRRAWLPAPVALAITGLSLVATASCARSAPTAPGSFELAEPTFDELVRTFEVALELLDRGRAMFARERLLAGSVEDLSMNADQQAGGDSRVALWDVELRLNRVGQHADEVGHYFELLRS